MTTGAMPFYLMFGREIRSKLPDLRREAPVTSEEVCDRDWSRKLLQKDYVDAKRRVVEIQVEIGDRVLMKNTKTNKLSPNYNPSPCEVVDRKGEVTVRSKAGVDVKRNVSFVKKYQERPSEEEKTNVEPAHQEQKETSQAREARGETRPLKPTGSPTPV